MHHRTSRNVARKGNGGTCPRLPSYPKKFISQIFVDLICDSCIPQYRTPQVEFKTKQKSSSSVRSIVLYPTLKIVPPHACLRGQLSIITIMLTSSYCPPTILPAPNYCSPRACTTLPQQLYIHCVQKKQPLMLSIITPAILGWFFNTFYINRNSNKCSTTHIFNGLMTS